MEPFCVKFYGFYQGMRDTDTDVSFSWNRIQKDIQESAEVHLPVLLGTLQMQWQRHLGLCCQMAQIVSNTTTRKLNIGVKNVNAALKLNIAKDIESDSDSSML